LDLSATPANSGQRRKLRFRCWLRVALTCSAASCPYPLSPRKLPC
jgi:hypothetical protein